MKARVYQLAKELGRTSKDLIEVLAELGIDVKNHMSTLSEDQVMRARAQLMTKPEPPKPEKPKKADKSPAKADDGADRPAAPAAETPVRPASGRPPLPRPGSRPGALPRPGTPLPRPGTPLPRPGGPRPGSVTPAASSETPTAKPPSPPSVPPTAETPSAETPPSTPPAPPAQTPAAEAPKPPVAPPRPPVRPGPPRPGAVRPGAPPPPPPQPGARTVVPPPRRPVPGGGAPGVRRPGGPPPRPGSGGQLPPRPGGRVQRGHRGGGIAPPAQFPPRGPGGPGGGPGGPGGPGGGPGRGGGRGRGGPRGGQRRSQYGSGGQGQKPRPRLKRRELTESTVDLSSRTSVEIHLPSTVRDFSAETGIRVPQLLKKLMEVGFMANINSALTEELVELLAVEFKFDDKLVIKAEEKAEDKLMAAFESEDAEDSLVHRAPIITFLGHVDHGKTSLLDAIRGSNVQAQEAGGITQHISAFRVETKDGKQVVFLDTPGHEAFTKMRARGADVTDVVVLVVAADDGVMPQTKEAISHAKAAGVKIVVALNKSDLPGANPDMVKTQLSSEGLQPEDWGGETVVVPTSAITREGIDDLLEFLALESELMDLKANPDRRAQGHVLEASVSGGRGVLTTLLVKNGTLKVGDYLIAGQAMGRVRALMDSTGNAIKEAPPATPVEMLGLNEAPEAGEPFIVVEDEKQAKEVAAERLTRKRGAMAGAKPPSSIDELMKGIAEKKVKEVKVLVKADVQGSVEVLRKELSDLGTDEVKINVIHAQVGGVNESDVLLANASGAIIIGFNVIADERARQAADSSGVSMSFYSVIYKITEDLQNAMEGMLEPEEKEEIQGHVEIRKVFKISRLGNIAGCYVQDGIITRNSRIRLARNGIVIHEGLLDNLKREKNDVKEVRGGLECGLKLAGYDDIKVGDTLEAFTVVKVKRTLSK